MREGWQTFIDYEKDLVVLDSFHSCETVLKSKYLAQADVIIMDIGLPGISGIDGVREITRLYPNKNIIMATVHDDDQHVFEALKAGAVGYLMKKVTPDELVAAIRDAHAGGSPITPNIARKVIEKMQAPEITEKEQLTERELQILKQLATGKSYATIGKTIYLSVDGVRHHIRSIYQKLQVHSRSEAVTKGIINKLIDPEAE